jgi:hypothetical protein
MTKQKPGFAPAEPGFLYLSNFLPLLIPESG